MRLLVARSELNGMRSAGWLADFDVLDLEVSDSADRGDHRRGCFVRGPCIEGASRQASFSLAGGRNRPGGCSPPRYAYMLEYRAEIALWALSGVLP